MSDWIDLCPARDAPAEGELREAETRGTSVCLARIGGALHALDNLCPHRQGPLAEGWIEGTAVVCPWHSWAFDVTTGATLPPEHAQIAVYPVRIAGEMIQIQLSEPALPG